MQMQKKVTQKDDGRYLVYYHFPETATAEETQVFDSLQAVPNEDATPGQQIAPPHDDHEEKAHV